MLPQSDLQFLQQKIQDLKNALFFSQNTSLLRIATTIVSVIKVDELGQMWFFVPRPQQALHEFDKEFPVRLEFFRKGKEYFLHVSGKAFIVTDPEDLNGLVDEDIREQIGGQMVLIRVKMMKADYFDNSCSSVHAGWMYNTRPGYKPYYLADAPLSLSVAS